MSNTSGIFPLLEKPGFHTSAYRGPSSLAAWAPGQVQPMQSGTAALIFGFGVLGFFLPLIFFSLNTFYNVRSQQRKSGLNKENHRSNAKTDTFEKLET